MKMTEQLRKLVENLRTAFIVARDDRTVGNIKQFQEAADRLAEEPGGAKVLARIRGISG